MVTLWQKAPDFEIESTMDRVKIPETGRWNVIFFYTKAFSPVCNSELIRLNKSLEKFAEMNAVLVGISTDSLEEQKKCSTKMCLEFPLASDPEGKVSLAYGVLNEQLGLAFRGTFIIDPEGVVKYMTISDLGTGRSVKEIPRVLKALQTGGMTPCEWQGGETLGKP